MELVIADANEGSVVHAGGTRRGLLSISQVRELFKDALKDGVYTIEGPGGTSHQFNLERWAGRDPDKTFVQISFRSAMPGIFSRRAVPPIP